MTFKRFIPASLAAFLVTCALWAAMAALVRQPVAPVSEAVTTRIVDIVRRKPEPPEVVRERPRVRPPKAEPPPAPPRLRPVEQRVTGGVGGIDWRPPPVDTRGPGPVEGGLLPLIKVQPVYPREALRKGITGYVVLEYTVTAAGTVSDIRVVESSPRGQFERASIAALERFRYKPRVVNGVPVAVSGLRHVFRFELEK
ncbi:MAG: hypothetical protein KatS3mg121_0441 [Gammaproteobacteria bacterium]|nr:MAG: hypothetical protein KatS3mg121_0441 [Gammaproteobacteria bacterium]